MKTQDRSIVYLQDYQPPSHLVDSLHLTFDLSEEGARVTNLMAIRRNNTGPTSRLELDGEAVKLEKLSLNNQPLTAGADYEIAGNTLSIFKTPEQFSLEVVTWIEPQNNTELSGLYRSKKMFCTQCEAQGFRRITYFLDRPDVMASYTTTIRADGKRYPVLLSNGNQISRKVLSDGRIEAVWQDPFKKPAYLFALVAGDLVCTEDSFTTMSSRKVKLQIFVEPGNETRVHHAMESLKKSMRWDEEKFGREYDLDIFMIVAVDDFNAGAMENKGLNIFNSKYVLADTKTATDDDFEAVEGVVAHEYFHNWTGNRITCRDWFQLSLKEGLTVFRDQEFSADMNSRAVKRIKDVHMLRTHQFAEDAGPMAHPIRPASYLEINNFYTLTVYEKGAEVIRMIQTLIGEKDFRRGMDKYFELYDGQAVTTEDFVHAMELASGKDLTQFKNWYNQAGTPEVFITEQYDPADKTLKITMRQTCRTTPESTEKKPFVIPVRTALIGVQNPQEKVLQLDQPQQDFIFSGVEKRPVVSYLRGFSAPVTLHTPHSTDDLLFLLANDNDSFQRWESLQTLWNQIISDQLREQKDHTSKVDQICQALKKALTDNKIDEEFRALLLAVPSESFFVTRSNQLDVQKLHQIRKDLIGTLALQLQDEMATLYKSSKTRQLKNACLGFLVKADEKWAEVAFSQQTAATNMTDEVAALNALASTPNSFREQSIKQFFEKWNKEYLVINKWLTTQAMIPEADTLDRVQKLAHSAAFDKGNPNKIYALYVAFSQQNTFGFHSRGADSYNFIADEVIELDAKNPQVASRLVRAFNHWKRFAEPNRSEQKKALEKIVAVKGLSKNVFEITSKSLQDN